MNDRLRRLTRDAQRDLASLAATSSGGAGSASALQYESALRGADTAKLQPKIDAYRELRAQVDALNASMRQAAAGDEFLAGINARISALQRQSAGAKMAEADLLALKAAEMGVAQQADPLIAKLRATAAAADEVAAASKRSAAGDSFLKGITSQANAIGKTRADLLELQAAELGVADKAAPMIAAIRKADEGFTKSGKSAKEMELALRGVPAQFTDIFVSLQGGQSPLQVFLQQGGQLKDMFGGIGQAARALGGYMLGLLTPMNLAAAAAVGLAVAYELGANEILALQKTVVLSGNAIGVTAGQLQAAAAAVRDIGAGTQGAASKIIGQFAANAAIASDNIERFTAAALRMERAGGPAAEETAKAFESLAKNPVQAANKLNESTNFLTTSLQNQIKALQDQGKTTDAARLAQEAYASAVEQRTPQVAATLGTIEKAWKSIVELTAKAVDRAKGIGRDLGVKEQIDELKAGIADIDAGKMGAAAKKDLPALREQLQLLEKGAGYQALSGAYERERALSTEANTRQQERATAAMGQQKRLADEILKIQEDGRLSGRDPTETERLAQLKALEYSAGLTSIEIRRRESALMDEEKRKILDITAAKIAGRVGELDYIEKVGIAEYRQLKIQESAVLQQMALARNKQDPEQELAELNARRQELARAAQMKLAEVTNATNQKLREQADATYQVLEAQRQEFDKEYNDALLEQDRARKEITKSLYGQRDALAEEAKFLALEGSLVGASSDQRQIAIEQLKIQLRLEQQLKLIRATAYPDAASREAAERQARANAELEAVNASTRVIQDKFKQTADSITDSLSNAVIDGLSRGASFADEIRKSLISIFKDMVLRPTIKAIISPIGNALGSLLGGGGGIGGGIGGLLGLSGTAQAGQAAAGSGLGGLLGQVTGLAGIAGSLGGLGSAFGAGVANTFAGGSLFGGQAAGLLAGGAGAGTGIAGLLGAAAPYALAAVVIANALKSKDAKLGFGASQIGADGSGATAIGRQFAFGNGKDIGAQAELATVSDTIAKSIAAQAKAFGGSAAGLQVQAATDIDRTGKGSGIIAILRDGKGTGPGIQTGGTNSSTTAASKLDNAADLSKFFAESSSAAIIAGLKASTLPKRMADYFATIDAFSLDQTKANEILAIATGVNSLTTALNPLGGVFSRLGDLGITATNDLASLVGGLDAFSAKAQSYVQAFYSRDEIAGIKAAEVKSALAAAGITQTVDTKEQFRALVDATDISTQTGREQLATLLNVSSAFAEVADYLAETNSSLAQVAQQAPKAGALLGLQPPEGMDAGPQITAIGAVETAVISVADKIDQLIDVIRDQGSPYVMPEVGGP